MQIFRSARQQAEKLSFEADKLVRMKREEGAIEETKKELRIKFTELGEIAYRLSSEGALDHPDLAAWAATVSAVEARLDEAEQRLEAIRNEKWIGESAEADAASPGHASTQAGPTKRCPKCGYSAPAVASFCPQCSHRFQIPQRAPVSTAGAGDADAEDTADASSAEPEGPVCGNCGAKLVEEAAFCRVCGSPVD